MSAGDLLAQARAGDLSGDDIQLVARHLHRHQDPAVREAAVRVAGAYLERRSHAQLLYALIAISEDAQEPEGIRAVAVRALARATGYRGKPVRLDL